MLDRLRTLILVNGFILRIFKIQSVLILVKFWNLNTYLNAYLYSSSTSFTRPLHKLALRVYLDELMWRTFSHACVCTNDEPTNTEDILVARSVDFPTAQHLDPDLCSVVNGCTHLIQEYFVICMSERRDNNRIGVQTITTT